VKINTYAVVCCLSIQTYAVEVGKVRLYAVLMAARHADTKREIVTCRIEPGLLAKLDTIAEHERRSRSEMIEMAVEELIARRGKKTRAK
jgi:hypothetical protein